MHTVLCAWYYYHIHVYYIYANLFYNLLIADTHKGSATEVLGVERTIEMQVSNLLSNF